MTLFLTQKENDQLLQKKNRRLLMPSIAGTNLCKRKIVNDERVNQRSIKGTVPLIERGLSLCAKVEDAMKFYQ